VVERYVAIICMLISTKFLPGSQHRHSRAADDTTAVVSQLVNIPSHVSSPTDVAAADSITAGPNDRTTPLPVHTLAINDGILCHCQEVSPAPYKPSAASRLDNAVALPNIHSCPVSVPQLPPPPPVPITSPLPLQQPDMFQTYTSNYHRCKSLPRTSTWPLGQSPHQTAAARTNMEI